MSKYFVALVASMLANFAFADTWYVSPEADDSTGTGTEWGSSITITNAVIKAQSGDTILVKGGTYAASPTVSFAKCLTIKGGMAGTDDTALHSTLTRSIFDFEKKVNNGFVVTSAVNDEWTRFERCVFTRAIQSGFRKSGQGHLEMIDCEFNKNGTGKLPNASHWGRGGYFQGTANKTKVILNNCNFTENATSEQMSWVNNAGGGFGAYFKDLNVEMIGCMFSSNGIPFTAAANKSTANSYKHQGYVFYASSAPIKASKCKFIANRAPTCYRGDVNNAYVWGGLVYLVGNGHGTIFNQCQFIGNEIVDTGSNSKPSSSYDQNSSKIDGSLVVDFSSSTYTCEVSRCTFAYNIADTKLGSAGITVRNGALNLNNSIFANNVMGSSANGRTTAGADLYLHGGYAYVEYTMFGGQGSEYVATYTGKEIEFGKDVIYGDAKLVSGREEFLTLLKLTSGGIAAYPRSTSGFMFKSDAESMQKLLNLDVHLLSTEGYRKNGDSIWYADSDVSSPAIDAGDPKADVGDEPFGENGNRINLGVYGGTSEASKSPSAGAIVLTQDNIEISYSEYGQPKISITAGVEPSTSTFEATANITITGTLIGETTPSTFALTIEGVKPGMKYESAFLNEYFIEGSELEISVTLTPAIGQPVSVEGIKTPMSGILPECAGHGSSDSHVIHYWPNAPGKNDGSSWLHAYTSLSNAVANLTADKNILWIAGDSVLTSVTRPIIYSPNYEVMIIGGFTGVEDSEEERAVGVISILDGNNAVVPFSLNNAAKVGFDSIKFMRGYPRNFVKSSGGDVTFNLCQFVDGTRCLVGSGGYYSGTSETVLAFTNCYFNGNGPSGAAENTENYKHGGYGAYVSSFKRVLFENCDFIGNGRYTGVTQQRGGYGGSAIYSSDAPLTVSNCRFEGNSNPISYNSNYGGSIGIVRLNGNCGGSAFTNCSWVANNEVIVKNDIFSGSQAAGTGVIVLKLTGANKNVDFVNCTFAYNVFANGLQPSTAGITLLSGSANIVNSIFYGSVTGATCNAGKYLHVAAGATANVRNSLFESAEDISFVDSGSVTTKNLIYGDPLFIYSYDQFKSELLAAAGTSLNLATVLNKINNGQLNYHLSGAGYYDESGVITNRVKGVKSPAVDAGVKVGEFKEPAPNGNKVNLGFYGNTPGATLSTGGFIIIIR